MFKTLTTLLFLCLAVSSNGEKSPLDVKIKTIDGKETTLSSYKAKAVLIVNTASECGFTRQYDGLQALHKKYGDKGLLVAGFPCNQFGGQEPGSEAEIYKFCKTRFGVDFPMFSKVEVNGKDRHPLYEILAGEGSPKPGKIGWNFEKFLVDTDGKIIARYRSGIEPESDELVEEIKKLLKL